MEAKNLDIADYLNIWRGALYSVILGIFIKQFMDNQPNDNSFWLVFIMLTFYIILDSSVRFYSRNILKKTYIKITSDGTDIEGEYKEPYYNLFKKDLPFSFVEFLLFFLETIGLIIILFSFNFIKKDGVLLGFFIQDLVLSIFLFTVVAHNLIQIGIATNSSYFNFVKKSILGDALELETIRENWQQKYDSVVNEIKNVYENIITESNEKKLDFNTFESKIKEKNISEKDYVKKTIKYHFLAQFSALHLILLNSVFFFILALKLDIINWIELPATLFSNWINKVNFFQENNLSRPIIILIGIVIIIFLFYCAYRKYKNVSNIELSSLKKQFSIEETIDKNSNNKIPEAQQQLLGNIFFILSLFATYSLALIINTYCIYVVIFLQQICVSLYIITSNK